MSVWPLVHERDSGIRPAGRPDECFYCGRKVGQSHKERCVIVEQRVEMRVRVTLPNGRTALGRWELEGPHFWTARDFESHKNESSWCCGNFLGERDKGTVTWDEGDERETWDALDALYSEESGASCLCNGELVFEFLRVLDATPRRKIRDVPGRPH